MQAPSSTPSYRPLRIKMVLPALTEATSPFFRRGAHVVLGGLHVTALPEEAAEHADTILLGPGEDAFPLFL